MTNLKTELADMNKDTHSFSELYELAQQQDVLIDNLKAQIAQQADTIAGWLLHEKNGYINIDVDKVEAWVERLKDISTGSADYTMYEKEQQAHLATIKQYNECVEELEKKDALIEVLVDCLKRCYDDYNGIIKVCRHYSLHASYKDASESKEFIGDKLQKAKDAGYL